MLVLLLRLRSGQGYAQDDNRGARPSYAEASEGERQESEGRIRRFRRFRRKIIPTNHYSLTTALPALPPSIAATPPSLKLRPVPRLRTTGRTTGTSGGRMHTRTNRMSAPLLSRLGFGGASGSLSPVRKSRAAQNDTRLGVFCLPRKPRVPREPREPSEPKEPDRGHGSPGGCRPVFPPGFFLDSERGFRI